MTDPVIVCVMALTPDREQMAKRAIRCLADQTCHADVKLYRHFNDGRAPLCDTMNEANAAALDEYPFATHIAKWDSDDWSAPERLAEQLALMERTGAWVVGYHTLPFYDVRTGEVLLYSNPNATYALGTSLLMRREAWEQFPFPDTSQRPGNQRGCGSDTLFVGHWAGRGKMHGVSGLNDDECKECDGSGRGYTINEDLDEFDTGPCWKCGPRMIATIHGGNTSVGPARGGFRLADEALARRVREIMEAA